VSTDVRQILRVLTLLLGILGLAALAGGLLGGWPALFGPGLMALLAATATLLSSWSLSRRLSEPQPLRPPEGRFGLGPLTLLLRNGLDPLQLLAGLGLLGLLGWLVQPQGWATPAELAPRLQWLSLGSALLVVSSLAAIARYLRDTPALPESPALARHVRATATLTLLSAAPLAARLAEWPQLQLEPTLAWIFLALPALATAELTLRAALRLSRWRRWTQGDRPAQPAGIDLVPLALFFSGPNPVTSVFDALEGFFGIDLKGTWALRYVRRSLEPLAALMLLAGWASTAVLTVPAQDTAVVERFGAAHRELGPGLHLLAPWPVESARRVSTARVHTLRVGHDEEPESGQGYEPEDTLWARQHADTEYTLLLGDGKDLLAFDGVLHYRVTDARAWLYAHGDPEAALTSLAYEAVTRRVVDQDLESVLSEDLAQAADEMRAEVEAQAIELGLGVQIVAFTLTAMHPPVAVAKDYQGVISARIDQRTRVLYSQTYTNEVLPDVRAEATRDLSRAEALALERLAEARGAAQAFTTLEASYEAAPDLFRFRRGLETKESQLANTPLILLDHRIESQGGDLWIIE
jgi:regulator of protease activity HflC (stomatin/prohibitin superfamily)